MIAREPQTAPRVALRPLRPSDLPLVHRWRTDPVAARYCGWDRPEVSTIGRIEGRYLPAVMDPEGADAWHYIIEAGGHPTGLITYDHLDPHNRSCRFELLLGDAASWGKGIGTDALHRILSLLFGPCEVRRVWCTVNAENDRALRCLRRSGFREEGRMRDAERFEGRWVDTVVLSLLEPEWRRHREPIAWTVSGLAEDEAAWFARMGDDAGCEPYEVTAALAGDEILVWRDGNVPAGTVSLIWRPGEVEIRILGVERDYRRQGLATRMLEEVRTRALARDIHRVMLVTGNDNCPAMTLYQRVGFHMTALYVGRPEQRRGRVRIGLCGIPLRDDVELAWDV